MSTEKLISFDLKADFGFFKKPDYNDGLLGSYNMLHKPALLGILGAIIGLNGYQKKGELPAYYQLLKNLPIGISPLKHQKGNFPKSSVKYTNTVGYANQDGNLLVEETMLINPSYRCYLQLNLKDVHQEKIYRYITGGIAEFIPYFGKNEYQAWFDGEVYEYQFEPFHSQEEFSVDSIFIKQGSIRQQVAQETYSFTLNSMTKSGSYCYFERLPVGFNEVLMQYHYNEFVYTDWTLQAGSSVTNLLLARCNNDKSIIQLF